jgi:hypothetical protein
MQNVDENSNILNYPVFKKKFADELIRQGFELIKTRPNANNYKLKVYYFENTREVRDALTSIIKDYENNKVNEVNEVVNA